MSFGMVMRQRFLEGIFLDQFWVEKSSFYTSVFGMRKTLFLYIFGTLIVMAFHSVAFGGTALEISDLTGEWTRLVWAQDMSPKSSDPFLTKNSHQLMGFDTDNNEGPVPILSRLSNYWTPLITPDGQRIVFSHFNKKEIFVVNWDGSGLKAISNGLATDIWEDPVSGIQWVYAIECDKWEVYTEKLFAFLNKYKVRGMGRLRRLLKLEDKPGWARLFRFRLDHPDVSEIVWDKTRVDGWFQLSHDGKIGANAFPWPDCGVALLDRKTWKIFKRGCWTSMAPDNSYRFWVFDGAHRNITIYSQGGTNKRKINISDAPGISGYEVYHPRWSNDIRIITMTGPYRAGEHKGGNQIIKGARSAEVYLGRFDKEFSGIEKWVKVTNNDFGDFSPDVWIANVRVAPALKEQSFTADFNIDKMADSDENLVFIWENNNAPNRVKTNEGGKERVFRVKARGQAKFGRFYDMDLAGGFMETEGVDKDLLEACRKTNRLGIEALITPANIDQDNLQRIITFSSDAGSANFRLDQHGEELIFFLKISEKGSAGPPAAVRLGGLRQGIPNHIFVTYAPGRLEFYLNGRRFEPKTEITGDFRNWTLQHLRFGDEIGGGYDWSGRLENIAIYNRDFTPEDIKFRYRLIVNRLKDRSKIERLEVDAILKDISITPQPEEIAPYRRCLALYTYEIQKVLSGTTISKRIAVYHWVILDNKILPNNRKKDQSYRLVLEPFDSHPQLEAERQVSDSDEFDLPLYYNAAG
jgi:hypothetical protein